jgi:hypothetical protein
MGSSIQIWNDFCTQHEVATKSVPLFEHSDSLRVATRQIGNTNPRLVLQRCSAMEALVMGETDKIVGDWKQGPAGRYDGLIYMVHIKTDDHEVVPLYIGKAEKHGKGDRNLSANLCNLVTDRSKFARWGDNYAYHIGDLSAVVLDGHFPAKKTPKYESWARRMFIGHPSIEPKLRQPVLFWAKAWSSSDTGIWKDFHPTRLAFLEYLMIGVAAQAFPEHLLNREGFGR